MMEQVSKIPIPNDATNIVLEPLLTIAEAAAALKVHYWHIQRAVKQGKIPFYTPFNGRKRVRLSDVHAFIETSRQSGGG